MVFINMTNDVKANTKIIILDNSKEDAKKIKEVLVNFGYTHHITHCETGHDFINALTRVNPDVVISEHTIPNYNSFKSFADSKSINPNVIFILSSGDIPEEFAIELLKEGMDDYILKDHLLHLPHIINSAQLQRQYITEAKKLEKLNNELIAANSLIDEKNKSMTQSIMFAERIQKVTLPKIDILLKDFKDAFIIYRPKDIVSGDFYWFYKKDDEVMVTAADCSGHGVSGALLSMIGTNFLNEIAENDFTHPTDVLSLLDLNLTTFLKQDILSGYQDGIDIAFVTIDKNHKKLYFSGCSRPLLIYRSRDKDMVEIKGEPYNIGGINKEIKKTFATQEIPYRIGDVIYMFSDGVVDQFGGTKNKKLMKKNFIEMLMSFQHLGLSYQKDLLEQKLNTWQGDFDQVDDMLILAIKL